MVSMSVGGTGASDKLQVLKNSKDRDLFCRAPALYSSPAAGLP